MIVRLKNNREAEIRIIQTTDSEFLFHYFENLSAASRSRFGPHPFDFNTAEKICKSPEPGTDCYVATDRLQQGIIAYMILKQGLTEWDEQRYAKRQQLYDHDTTITWAPSVADAWQNSGLGAKMFEIIRNDMKLKGIRNIILWGGVQETNEIAVHFYRKQGFQLTGSFFHDNKNNLDMVLAI